MLTQKFNRQPILTPQASFSFLIMLLFFLRFIVVSDTEIVGAPADTEGLARGVLCVHWFCGGDPMRPPLLALLGALVRVTGLPWRLVLEAIFLGAVFVLSREVRDASTQVVGRGLGTVAGGVAAAILLFHPYTIRSFTEFYREPLILCLYVLLFSVLLRIFRQEAPHCVKNPALWLFGLLYAAIAFTREGEAIILAPLLIMTVSVVGWRGWVAFRRSQVRFIPAMLPSLAPVIVWKAVAMAVFLVNLAVWRLPDANGLFPAYKALLSAVHRIKVDDAVRYAPATRQSFAVALRLSPTFAEFGQLFIEDSENIQILRLHSSYFVGRMEIDPSRTFWGLHNGVRSHYGSDDRLIREKLLAAAGEINAALDHGDYPAHHPALPYPFDANWGHWLPLYPAALWRDIGRMAWTIGDDNGPAARPDYRPPDIPDLFDRALNRRIALVSDQFSGWRSQLRQHIDGFYRPLSAVLLAVTLMIGVIGGMRTARAPLSPPIQMASLAVGVWLAALGWRIALYAVLSVSVAPVARYQIFAAPLFVVALIAGALVAGVALGRRTRLKIS